MHNIFPINIFWCKKFGWALKISLDIFQLKLRRSFFFGEKLRRSWKLTRSSHKWEPPLAFDMPEEHYKGDVTGY